MSKAWFVGIMATEDELQELRDILDICIQRHPLGDNSAVELELLNRLWESLGRAR